MKQQLRLKSHYHLLRKDGYIDFIKTLDEGIRIPENEVLDYLISSLQETSATMEIVSKLKSTYQIPENVAEKLIQKFIDLGVFEYFTDDLPIALNRYHRQLLLFDAIQSEPQFETHIDQQLLLTHTHVLILGIGGIGNFIALSLTASGIGKITLVDFDVVEETNLNRQVLFSESDLGKSKVLQAASRLMELNSKCTIVAIEKSIKSILDLEELVRESGPISYLVLAADQPPELVLWASSLCPKYNFKYIKCGYMSYQGLIGPLLGPKTKSYEQLFEHWGATINLQDQLIQQQNEKFIAPSMAASNAILSNIAALEMIKDISGIVPSCLIEKRLLFNLKTMELKFG
ncbi:MAG: ThiF family adenylyltransferase [Bacteroidetes bacterium]|nr:ThiF family adenylyltransferase [Bacteroidota bacterium]